MDGAEGQRKIFASSEVSPLGTFERLATATQPAESNLLGNAREAQGTVKMGHSKGSVDREGAQTNLHARRHWFGWPQARGAMSSFSRPPTQPRPGLWLVFSAAATLLGCQRRPPSLPPPDVEVVTVSPTDIPVFQEWIGTLDGFVNAQIRAQVSGYLLTQAYAEGSQVRKGDRLFQIDPRTFQAALEQAKAKLAQDRAQFGKTQLDVRRYTPLAREQAISKEELDNAEQANLAAEAQVKADEAAVKIARLNLDFTKVASPIDGLAGIALAQIGDLVSPSTGPLTTVSTIHPIKAYFQISEQLYLSMGWHDILSKSASSGVELELILSDGSAYPEKGRVYFADRQMNPSTGTLQIVGLFPNPRFTLRPGQYGRIRAQTDVKRNVLALPQRAVTELQGSYQIAVIGEENKVHVESVKVGEQVGSIWIIEAGLQPGDRVVVEGLQKAREGRVVNPTSFKGSAPTPQPPTLGVASPISGHRPAN